MLLSYVVQSLSSFLDEMLDHCNFSQVTVCLQDLATLQVTLRMGVRSF